MSKDELNARWVRTAAMQGALVWWIYGIAETAFSVGIPNVRLALSSVFPDLLPPGGVPRVVGTLQTAVLLLTYLAVGAALSALQAGLISLFRARRIRAAAPSILWSAVATLTLVAVFALNALAAGEALVVPAVILPFGLSILRLDLAWRPGSHARWMRLTHPLTVSVILVGSAFLMQPRPELGQALVYSLGIAYGFGVLLIAWATARSGWRRPQEGITRHQWPMVWGTVALFSFVAIAATLPQDPRQRPLRRPAASPRSGDQRPNVILITWDTVRADHLSLYSYGRDTTPFLRELGRENATIYTHAIATSNWTLPTLASIFTGQNPRSHAAHYYSRFLAALPIAEQFETLAEVLSREGYRTGGIVANTHVLVPAFGFDRGFSYYDYSTLPWPFVQEPRCYLLREAVRILATSLVPRKSQDSKYVTADEINEGARRFLESPSGNRQPFFLFLNYMDAHTPYVPPPPFADRFPGRDKQFRWARASKRSNETGRLLRPLAARELQHLTSQYDGAIAYLDDRLRRLFGTLRNLGLYDNSLIIVTADHGEAFGEAGLIGHGVSVYQHQIHVPLIVKFPSPAPGATVDILVSASDLFATVLDVVGAKHSQALAGRSLRHIQSKELRWICSESDWEPKDSCSLFDARPREVAVISGTMKVIYRRDGATEVYDLAADPTETRNLHTASQLPAEWAARLSEYLKSEATTQAGFRVPDPDTIRRLRALGYLN
ncbi:MAG: sulfatase [Acidobacteria bacterium]|nr:sulfatase [Acidobacteriota bacterium]MBU4308153.1 sulfatase [Acidobacteriota bacterium]MBU4405683.1 sulfatase [Acidobacteriota bacterium]MCG2811166.1 sulfatase [Candidatus Aminicenantes bacterium]